MSDVQSGYRDLNAKVSEINRLISDIYQLAKADSLSLDLDKREYSLALAFSQWESDWSTLVIAKGFAWHSDINLGDATMMMDADRVKQIIDNLLSNSIHYTDLPGSIKLTATFAKQQLTVRIEDSAPSVDDDKLAKIFERLYRVESSRSRQTGGSGLGLAICKSLVEAHGGKIRAKQSELGGLLIEFTIS